MPLTFTPLSPALGAQVHGLDTAAIGERECSALRDALLEHGLLLIRETPLDPDAHVAITRALGEPEVHPITTTHVPGHPEIIIPKPGSYTSQAAGADDQLINRIPWHQDLTYTTTPSRGALLRAIELPPEGGDTGFIDTAAVFAALPAALQMRVLPLEVYHRMSRAIRLLNLPQTNMSGESIAAKFPDIVQPLAPVHPLSGRRVLFLGYLFADAVVGMDSGESEELLRDLMAFATSDRFTYMHSWHPDDMLVWDNWRMLHTAAGYKPQYRRVMHRTTLRGDYQFGRSAQLDARSDALG